MPPENRPDTVPAMLSRIAESRPGAVAFVHRGSETTYSQLCLQSERIAAGLAALGVGKGDRVALWLPNAPFWFAVFAACCRLGAIAVAVNTRFRAAEVEDVVARSAAKLLVMWPGFKGIDFPAILARASDHALRGLETVVEYREGAGLPGAMPRPWRTVPHEQLLAHDGKVSDAAAPDTGCIVFTTSGTTKAPKFVLHPQRGIVRHAADVARDFGLDAPESAGLLALPACGVFGFCQAMAALSAGRPTVLMPSFDAAEAVALIDAHRVTHLNGSDEIIRRMLAADNAGVLRRRLRLAGFAAFNSGYDDLEAAAARGDIPLIGLYGMSEVQALFARRALDDFVAHRLLPGGRAVSAEARVRIRDPDTGALLGPGEPGEIELSGPSAMVGYLGDDEATGAARTADGFFRTGDLGSLEPDGSFVFLARMGDAMRLGGYLVSPAEIEAEIACHPSVEECYAVAVPVDGRPRAVAFVRLSGGADFDEAAAVGKCAARLAGYKVPARIFAVAEFPMSDGANGRKVRRAALRRMAESLIDS